ncbi:MAG: transporter substrate-binding protein [Chlamydiales bacterium]|nr:transporter substrate-binding protein [Chlamydiales bacterium]
MATGTNSSFRKGWIYIGSAAAVVVVLVFVLFFSIEGKPGKIPVGVLYSQTGEWAQMEKPAIQATLLAIEEINAKGGIRGRKLKPILVDARSSEEGYLNATKELIVKHKVPVIFGGWNSVSRLAIQGAIEDHSNLLISPAVGEGIEDSPSVISTGAADNQRLVPAITWSVQSFGKKIMVILSKSYFSKRADELITDVAHVCGGEIIAKVDVEQLSPKEILKQIEKEKPDVVLNLLDCMGNRKLRTQMQEENISFGQTPVMYVQTECVLEAEENNSYFVCSYYEELPDETNQLFVSAFHQKYGEQPISELMESSYVGVYLWAQVVRQMHTADSQIVKSNIRGQALQAPEGIVYVEPQNNHLWKTVRVVRLKERKGVEEVWSSNKPMRPSLFFFFEVY